MTNCIILCRSQIGHHCLLNEVPEKAIPGKHRWSTSAQHCWDTTPPFLKPYLYPQGTQATQTNSLREHCINHAMTQDMLLHTQSLRLRQAATLVFNMETRLQLNVDLISQGLENEELSAAHASFFGFTIERDLSQEELRELEEETQKFAQALSQNNGAAFLDSTFSLPVSLTSKQLVTYFEQFQKNPPISSQEIVPLLEKQSTKRALQENLLAYSKKPDQVFISLVNEVQKNIAPTTQRIESYWHYETNTPESPKKSACAKWIQIQKKTIQDLYKIGENLQLAYNYAYESAIEEEINPALVLEFFSLASRFHTLYFEQLDRGALPAGTLLEKKAKLLPRLLEILPSPALRTAVEIYLKLERLPQNIQTNQDFQQLSPTAKIFYAFAPKKLKVPCNSEFAWTQAIARCLPDELVNARIDKKIESDTRGFLLSLWNFMLQKALEPEDVVFLFQFRKQAILKGELDITKQGHEYLKVAEHAKSISNIGFNRELSQMQAETTSLTLESRPQHTRSKRQQEQELQAKGSTTNLPPNLRGKQANKSLQDKSGNTDSKLHNRKRKAEQLEEGEEDQESGNTTPPPQQMSTLTFDIDQDSSPKKKKAYVQTLQGPSCLQQVIGKTNVNTEQSSILSNLAKQLEFELPKFMGHFIEKNNEWPIVKSFLEKLRDSKHQDDMVDRVLPIINFCEEAMEQEAIMRVSLLENLLSFMLIPSEKLQAGLTAVADILERRSPLQSQKKHLVPYLLEAYEGHLEGSRRYTPVTTKEIPSTKAGSISLMVCSLCQKNKHISGLSSETLSETSNGSNSTKQAGGSMQDESD